MAIYTQTQLLSASNATYVTNASNDITAANVRVLNTDWISSSVLLPMTGSLTVLSSSFAVTASFLTGNVISASFAETASISRNLVVRARNGSAGTLTVGTVVHITNAVGDNPIFTTASFTSEALSSNTLGVLRADAISNADVDVVVNGIVTGVNTDPALGFVAGDILYLSSSGQFTRVQPQAPEQIVVVGQVLRVQQNNGSIYVKIANGWELDELHNVRIISASFGDLIVNSGSLYINSKQLTGSYGLTGSLTATEFTGSLQGTSSFASQALSSSFATTASFALNAGGGGGTAFPHTGSAIISGSLIVTGSVQSNIFSGSVVSSTASVDLNQAGVFTFTLNASGVTNFNFTNPGAGRTANLVITTATGATASFSSNVKQPTGSLYTPSSGSGRIDILSALADGTNVYLTYAKTMV